MFGRLTEQIREYFTWQKFVDPVTWICENIDLSRDLSAPRAKVDLSLTPYLIDPLRCWDFSGVIREVTIMAPEQTGKSASWVWGLLWSFEFMPCLSIVCYPSDEYAADANYEKLMPLMRGIPRLRQELERPNSKTKDHYHFSNIISYFMGSGARVTSKSAKIRVADELDDWQVFEKRISNLDDLRKRARAFDESLLYMVCTPTTEEGEIWKQFRRSSQGYWHLRCQGCGKLTIRSCDVHHLQFEVEIQDNRKAPIPGSERLICPECKFEHTEEQKRQLNIEGGYIHRVPELLETRPGFQWGALASQLKALSWTEIAEKQLLAGRSGNIKDQKSFDNSIRGLPWRQRKIIGDQEKQLRGHCADRLPLPDEIEAVFITADTQDYGWKWEARALDVHSNRYLLAYGVCKYLSLTDEKRAEIDLERREMAEREGKEFDPVKTLEDVIYAKYCGIEPLLVMIDEGGHRKREVYDFVMTHEKVIAYKGDGYGNQRWRWSDKQEKLILAHRREYQSDLLYYLYSQNNRENNYWYLLPEDNLTDDYITELGAIRKDESKREGHLYENWTHGGRTHDYFDTGMMYLVLEDVAIQELPLNMWRHGKAEIITAGLKESEEENIQGDNNSDWVMGWNRF